MTRRELLALAAAVPGMAQNRMNLVKPRALLVKHLIS